MLLKKSILSKLWRTISGTSAEFIAFIFNAQPGLAVPQGFFSSLLGNGHRNSEFGDWPVLVPEDRRKRITMLAAGFCDPSSQALRNFHCFCNASALRHQPWNVRTCAQVAAVVKVLYADTNRHFLNFCQMFLPSHRHHPLRKSLDKFYHAASHYLVAFLRRQSLREKLAADFLRWPYCRGRHTGLELTARPTPR
jgi:hypothetical protein